MWVKALGDTINTLPLTLFFLFLLALLSYGSLNKGVDQIVQLKLIKGAMEEERKEQQKWQHLVYLIEKGKTIEGQSPLNQPKKEKTKRSFPKPGKPLIFPIKLNLALATKGGDKRISYRQVCEKLLNHLYQDYPPFHQHPQVANTLIDHLLDALKDKDLQFPEQLASLDMGDLQPLWQEILLGDKCPPLLDHFYFKKSQQPTINIVWASKELLDILFDDPIKVSHLLALQEKAALAELDEEYECPSLDQFKEVAEINTSPYSPLLTCKFPRKLPF